MKIESPLEFETNFMLKVYAQTSPMVHWLFHGECFSMQFNLALSTSIIFPNFMWFLKSSIRNKHWTSKSIKHQASFRSRVMSLWPNHSWKVQMEQLPHLSALANKKPEKAQYLWCKRRTLLEYVHGSVNIKGHLLTSTASTVVGRLWRKHCK